MDLNDSNQELKYFQNDIEIISCEILDSKINVPKDNQNTYVLQDTIQRMQKQALKDNKLIDLLSIENHQLKVLNIKIKEENELLKKQLHQYQEEEIRFQSESFKQCRQIVDLLETPSEVKKEGIDFDNSKNSLKNIIDTLYCDIQQFIKLSHLKTDEMLRDKQKIEQEISSTKELNDELKKENEALKAKINELIAPVSLMNLEVLPSKSLIPTFNGLIGDSIRRWIDIFDKMCQNLGINESEKTKLAGGYLKGRALEIFKKLTDKNSNLDWEKLKLKLKEEFNSHSSRPYQQGDNYNLYELEFNQWCKDNNFLETEKIRFFIDGLKRKCRARLMNYEPRSFNDAKRKAQQYESEWLEDCKRRKRRRVNVN